MTKALNNYIWFCPCLCAVASFLVTVCKTQTVLWVKHKRAHMSFSRACSVQLRSCACVSVFTGKGKKIIAFKFKHSRKYFFPCAEHKLFSVQVKQQVNNWKETNILRTLFLSSMYFSVNTHSTLLDLNAGTCCLSDLLPLFYIWPLT